MCVMCLFLLSQDFALLKILSFPSHSLSLSLFLYLSVSTVYMVPFLSFAHYTFFFFALFIRSPTPSFLVTRHQTEFFEKNECIFFFYPLGTLRPSGKTALTKHLSIIRATSLTFKLSNR